VMLAKALLVLDIAIPGDWKKRNATQHLLSGLRLSDGSASHGGIAIRHRFLLSAVISTSPSDWADREETRPDQLFLILEPSEATCGCGGLWQHWRYWRVFTHNCGDVLPSVCWSGSIDGFRAMIITMLRNGGNATGMGHTRTGTPGE